MMTKNYFYAIKNTKEIFESWTECEPHVKGVKGVQYRKFKTVEEANAFINGEDMMQEKPVVSKNATTEPKKAKNPKATNYVSPFGVKGTITAAEEKDPFGLPLKGNIYAVDGSFNSKTDTYGAGVVEYDKKQNIIRTNRVSGTKSLFANSHNIAGETLAMRTAIDMAIQEHQTEITLICDYEGDFRWTAPESVVIKGKACWGNAEKTPIASFHKQSIEHAAKNGIKKIHFVWVREHKGIDANEMVDRLAKEACGIE